MRSRPLLSLIFLGAVAVVITQTPCALAKGPGRSAPKRWLQATRARVVNTGKVMRQRSTRLLQATRAKMVSTGKVMRQRSTRWLQATKRTWRRAKGKVLGSSLATAVMLAPTTAMAAPSMQQLQQWASTGDGKMILAGSAAAVVAAGAGTWVYLRGRGKDRQWLASESHTLMKQADKLASRDPAQLAQLVQRGRSARQAAERKLQAASTRKEKKLASREVAFTGLAAAYAALVLNVSTENPANRVGAHLPKVWKQKLGAAELEAKRSKSDGKVALLLQDLSKEVDQQRAVTERHRGALEGFDKAKPMIFAKNMKRAMKRVHDAVGTFGKELDVEQKLLTAKTTAMRGRVSDRLANKSAEYKEKRTYLGELDTFVGKRLGPVVTLAHQISDNLSTIASARQQETTYLAMAASRTRVPVQKTRTKYVNGKAETEHYTDYEDQSGYYRMMAANEASTAQSNATEAQSRISSLNTHLRALRGHAILTREGGQMPGAREVAVAHGRGWAGAYLLPPTFNLIGNLFSDTTSAINQFAPVRGAIDHVAGHIDGRRGQLRGWVNQKIDAQLASEIALAR